LHHRSKTPDRNRIHDQREGMLQNAVPPSHPEKNPQGRRGRDQGTRDPAPPGKKQQQRQRPPQIELPLN